MAKEKAVFNDNYIFGLDIGTRSIVGVVGYNDEGKFHVMAYARYRENSNRSPLCAISA